MSKETLLAVGRVIKELKAEYASELTAANQLVVDTKEELLEKLAALGAVADGRAVDAEQHNTTVALSISGLSDSLIKLRETLEEVDPRVDNALRSIKADMVNQSDTIFGALRAELVNTEEKLSALIEQGNTFTSVELSKQEAKFEEVRADDFAQLTSTGEELEARVQQVTEGLAVIKVDLVDIIENQHLDTSTLSTKCEKHYEDMTLELVTLREQLETYSANHIKSVNGSIVRDQDYLKRFRELDTLLTDQGDAFSAFTREINDRLGVLLNHEEAITKLENHDGLKGVEIEELRDSLSLLSGGVQALRGEFGNTLTEQVSSVHAAIAGLKELLHGEVSEEAGVRATQIDDLQKLIEGIPDFTPALKEFNDWADTVEARWQEFETAVYAAITKAGFAAEARSEALGADIAEIDDSITTLTTNYLGLAANYEQWSNDHEGLSTSHKELSGEVSSVRQDVTDLTTQVCDELVALDGKLTDVNEVHILDPENPRAQAGRMYRHDNALWRCHKDTTSPPSVADPDWELLQDALKSIDTSGSTVDAFSFKEVWAGGKEKTHYIELPKIKYRKTYDATLLYSKYDSTIDDGHRWVAVKDHPAGPPHKSSDWLLFGMRGPQGKRGPKGVQGPQGAPGVPAPSLKEMVIAVTEFMEGTDGIPMRRFMGAWVYQRAYLRGDLVVMSRGALYLANVDNDGGANPYDFDNGIWQLVYEGPSFPPTIHKMEWAGYYEAGKTYQLNNVVLDDGWTMIALRATTARPAPYTVGSPSYDMPDTPTFAEQTHIGQVASGHEYVFSKAGWAQVLQEWKPVVGPTISYRFVIQFFGLEATPVKTTVIDAPAFPDVEDAWASFINSRFLVSSGDRIRVFSVILNSSDTTPYTGAWTKTANNNALGADPGSGSWGTRGGHASVRISKLDDTGADRSADLVQFTAGTSITLTDSTDPSQYINLIFNAAPVDQGTHYSWDNVTELDEGPGGDPDEDDLCTLDAAVPTPASTVYPEVVDHWLTGQPDWAAVEGLLELDGVVTAGITDNAYGVRLQFQEGAVSADWDVVAPQTI